MQLVDGSSDVRAVGGTICSVSYSSLLTPLHPSVGPLASKPAVRPFTDPSHSPAPLQLSPVGVRRSSSQEQVELPFDDFLDFRRR